MIILIFVLNFSLEAIFLDRLLLCFMAFKTPHRHVTLYFTDKFNVIELSSTIYA